ncbi:MAG: DUF3341 domain-containing protein, partial [Acidobacteriota bacterium]|nr:DUF3341 domain-containing protein [Acidobacteriota bacterium]
MVNIDNVRTEDVELSPAPAVRKPSAAPTAPELSIDDWIVGSFRDEAHLLAAIRQAKEQGLVIHDVFAPYPVHGLDEAIGLRRSRLGYVTMGAGLCG